MFHRLITLVLRCTAMVTATAGGPPG